MEGRHPRSGGWLRKEGGNGGRGGGIDLTFSAPKSVSILWALGDPQQRQIIERAHANAGGRGGRSSDRDGADCSSSSGRPGGGGNGA